ncbi:hypothetical protein LH462_06585 [Laribacter hongkongensis]|uniref:hypothetical protein n=1 Tax=Laribacter hongkongensis TaxID=168471 RepID=UPI001EFE3E5A|nr:hypothetical protein [Laribacter hongkongensis]MCG9099810.1 hypothetical protein [Laribacter hongkongensis]MCG9103388.1 hypothetical protein [Laribacter hongkongensis]MCG9111288.1 hypothetical protein [Laribacter hongkongensis]MCG9118556.1 hypothetical protein [Laribacter hongkongensis]
MKALFSALSLWAGVVVAAPASLAIEVRVPDQAVQPGEAITGDVTVGSWQARRHHGHGVWVEGLDVPLGNRQPEAPPVPVLRAPLNRISFVSLGTAWANRTVVNLADGRRLEVPDNGAPVTGFWILPGFGSEGLTYRVAGSRTALSRPTARNSARITGQLGQWLNVGTLLTEASGARVLELGPGGSSAGSAMIELRAVPSAR